MTAPMHGEAAAQEWQAAVTAQRVAIPDHAHFYALAAEMVPTLHALQDLANVLRRQVTGYADGRAVYDDSRQVDPVLRLAQAAEQLALLRDRLAAAQDYANGFWSAISHIGIEVQP